VRRARRRRRLQYRRQSLKKASCRASQKHKRFKVSRGARGKPIGVMRSALRVRKRPGEKHSAAGTHGNTEFFPRNLWWVRKASKTLREFLQHFAELIEDLKPVGREEMTLVETIAVCDWRYRRSLRAERGEIINGFEMEAKIGVNTGQTHRCIPDVEATTKLLRYQSQIFRQKMQALQMLEKLQQRCRASRPPALPANDSSFSDS
jgi:hypothetical protein